MFSKLKKRQKREILRLLVSALLFAAALLVERLFLSDDAALFSKMWLLGLLVYLPAFVFAGGKTIAEAASNLTRGQIFDENFLMSVAALAALVLGEFTEGVAVMLFAGIGELFESYATSNARGAIDSLAELCPDKAELLVDGLLVTVSADEVKVGDIFEVGAGRRIALDGVVEEGSASVDCSSLTGESLPISVGVGDSVSSGTVNLDGRLRIRATAPASESAAARIVATVEDAASGKSKTEAFISRFAAIYTPAVCAAALAVGVLPPLLFNGSFKVWIYRALSFLVVSCPCALVISVPLTFFGAVGASAKKGILFKDNSKIETLSKLTTVAFDKTGTLTEGRPTLERVELFDNGFSEEKLLEFAAAAEYSSIHPLARATIEHAPATIPEDVSELVEHPGLGRTAVYRGHTLALGNEKLMSSVGAKLPETACDGVGTSVCLAVDGKLVGRIYFADRLKGSSRNAIDSLRTLGIKTVMLSGDSKAVATSVAKELSIDEALGELLPEEKLDALKGLIEKGKTGFVGDGINDSPALARADVGFAMGAHGSDAAIDAADVVISSDDPLRVPDAVRVARKTMRIARENIVFAIGVKLLAIALIGFGVVGMWMAVIADVGVSVVAILNSMRMLSAK